MSSLKLALPYADSYRPSNMSVMIYQHFKGSNHFPVAPELTSQATELVVEMQASARYLALDRISPRLYQYSSPHGN